MSLNANGSDVIMHQARADLYDYDLLSPPGNMTHLAAMLYDPSDAAGGAAYLAPLVLPDVVASTPNLASMATHAPLGGYLGRRLLAAFRYSSNVFNIGWGIDNVQIVECPAGMFGA